MMSIVRKIISNHRLRSLARKYIIAKDQLDELLYKSPYYFLPREDQEKLEDSCRQYVEQLSKEMKEIIFQELVYSIMDELVQSVRNEMKGKDGQR